jgi:hypothetical protein
MSLPPATDTYIGEPQYPSPWATKRPKEGLRDNDAAIIVSLAPDVCRSPTVPVPYPIVDFCGHDENYTPSVRFTGQKAMVLRSNTQHVHGDEPGVGKGIKSGTVGDISEPIGHAPEVRAEGSPVIRHLDRFWMNRRNTQGEAIFVRDMKPYQAPKDDDPVPGSLVMSDASPEPLIMGAQYAQALEKPVPIPTPTQSPGVKPFDPSKLPPAANDNEIKRRGTYGKPKTSGAASRIFGLLGLATAGYQLGDMAGQWYVGPDGVMGQAIGNHLRGQVPLTSPQAGYVADLPWHFGSDANIANANDLLSLKAGHAVDFRTMDPDELEKLLKKPWPPAEQLKENEKTRTKPAPLPQTETVRVDEEKKWPCLVGPYSVIQPICPGEAHHIVPDMVYRLGPRPKGAATSSSTDRIPNAPTLNEGMSVCLTEAMHGSGPEGLHGKLRGQLNTLGSQHTPNGTAPIGKILGKSMQSIDDIPGLSKECKEKAKAAAAAQVSSRMKPSQPGRAWEKPLPGGAAYDVLSRGSY